MTYRNGFLEGLDGAAKIIGMYNSLRDRQDEREWRQKKWEYETGRDAVKDKQWQDSHDLNVRKQDHAEKYQNAALAETSRHHRASESVALANHGLARANHDYLVRKEQEQEDADRAFFGANGEESGITSDDVSSLPYAINGSFGELGNYAAKVFNIHNPEGSKPNGVFGLLDVGNNNVIVGYLDRENGSKRVHTTGEPMPRDQVAETLRSAGAPDDQINTLLGAHAKRPEPTEADLSAGIDYSKLNRMKSELESRMAQTDLDDRARAWWKGQYDKQIAAEQSSIDAQRQANLDRFNTAQANKEANARIVENDVNTAIAQQQKIDASNQRNIARLDMLANIYPKASKEVKARILEEAQAIRSMGMDSGLSGGALVKAYRKQQRVEEAQNEGMLEAVKGNSKEQTNTQYAHSKSQRATPKEVNDFAESVKKDVTAGFDAKSGDKGVASSNVNRIISHINDRFAGGISKRHINSPAFRSQVVDIANAMTKAKTSSPHAGLFFMMRHQGDEPKENADIIIQNFDDAYKALRKQNVPEQKIVGYLDNAIRYMIDNDLDSTHLNDAIRKTTGLEVK